MIAQLFPWFRAHIEIKPKNLNMKKGFEMQMHLIWRSAGQCFFNYNLLMENNIKLYYKFFMNFMPAFKMDVIWPIFKLCFFSCLSFWKYVFYHANVRSSPPMKRLSPAGCKAMQESHRVPVKSLRFNSVRARSYISTC
jgi:hypothetical protein